MNSYRVPSESKPAAKGRTSDYEPGYPPEFVDGDGHAWFDIGRSAVDSGMLMLTDPCYVRDFVSDDPAFEQREAYPYSYSGACAAATWDDYDQIGGNRGVVMGCGDGFYTVLGRFNDEGTLLEIRLQLRS